MARAPRWSSSLVAVVVTLLPACQLKFGAPGDPENPCPALAESLPGTWVALTDGAGLPDWFRITPGSSVDGIIEQDGLTLAYGIDTECTGIMITDAAEQLHRSWDIEPRDGTLVVTGPWAHRRTYFRTFTGRVDQGVGTGPGAGPIRTHAVWAAVPGRAQRFPGERDSPFSVVGSDGIALPVRYGESLRSPADPSLGVAPFEIVLAADLDVAGRRASDVADGWSIVEAPAVTAPVLERRGLGRATLSNVNAGGLYRIRFDPGGGGTPTVVNVYLPLACADVDAQLLADLETADAFAAARRLRPDILSNLKLWFWDGGNGDYAGRGEPEEPTWRAAWSPYNPVLAATTNSHQVLGGGSVVTWAGVPTRCSNLSNFLIGYTLARLGQDDYVIWFVEQGGTSDSIAAHDLYWAGVHLARGEIGWVDVRATVGRVFSQADERNRNLWPNRGALANHVSFHSFRDPDHQFTSPGFLSISP